MNKLITNLKNFSTKNYYYFYPAVFIFLSLILILINNSFIFEQDFITKYGDQQIYYKTALAITKFRPELSIYTIGYPALMVPLIILTGIQDNWESIMTVLIAIQSFILMPVSIYFVFRNKTKKYAFIAAIMLLAYLVFFILRSEDPLVRYNVLGLIPLSEPLTVFCLIGAYHIYFKYLHVKGYRKRYLVVFSILFTLGILTRNVSLLLYAPIFLDMLFDKRFREIFFIGIISIILYIPQLIYNIISTGELLFNGYGWLEKTRVEKNTEYIKRLYGIESSSLFSIEYFKVNVSAMLVNYLPFVFLYTLILIRKHRIAILVAIFSLINLIFHLSYWWTKAGGLFERFLLPNLFLLLFIFQNTQLKEYEKNIDSHPSL